MFEYAFSGIAPALDTVPHCGYLVPIQKWWISVQAKAEGFCNRRRSETMQRIAKSENAGMDRKTPFMDGHKLTN